MSFDWSTLGPFCSWTPELHEAIPSTVLSESTTTLIPREVLWLLRSAALEKQGFVLRPRYRVGWKPSWWATHGRILFRGCEDAIFLDHHNIVDATRVSDGTPVFIKAVPKGQESEVTISRFLSSPEFLQNPHNHCVRIYDVLQDPLNPEGSLLVMQGYLRPALLDRLARKRTIDFGYVGEVLDFIQQTLEAIAFIHSQGVAHGRISRWTIYMDARCLFPRGHHPIAIDKEPDGVTDAHALPRIDQPIQYYLVNFSNAVHVAPGDPCVVPGRDGSESYDVFKEDVYALGCLYRSDFTHWFEPLRPLAPMVALMMHPDANLRPSATEALAMFRSIRRAYFQDNRYSPLWRWWQGDPRDNRTKIREGSKLDLYS